MKKPPPPAPKKFSAFSTSVNRRLVGLINDSVDPIVRDLFSSSATLREASPQAIRVFLRKGPRRQLGKPDQVSRGIRFCTGTCYIGGLLSQQGRSRPRNPV